MMSVRTNSETASLSIETCDITECRIQINCIVKYFTEDYEYCSYHLPILTIPISFLHIVVESLSFFIV